MKILTIFLGVSFVIIGCKQKSATQTNFYVPAGVVYETNEDVGFNSFSWDSNGETALFILSPHPAGLLYDMVNKMANDTAVSLEPELRKIDGVQSVRRKDGDIAAGNFLGKEIIFEIEKTNPKNIYQCIYVLWDGSRLWQGQLTCPHENDLAVVHQILKSSTKN